MIILLFLFFVISGKIWCTFLESTKSGEFVSLSSVVIAVTKVMDQPESSHIVDAGEYRTP